MNPDLTPFQRRYVSYVKRCDELERKLRFFANEIGKFELEMVSAGVIDNFVNSSVTSGSADGSKRSGAQLLESLEVEIEQYESQLKELNSYSETARRGASVIKKRRAFSRTSCNSTFSLYSMVSFSL